MKMKNSIIGNFNKSGSLMKLAKILEGLDYDMDLTNPNLIHISIKIHFNYTKLCSINSYH